MSDLLPLVTATLRDKALMDAKSELENLHRRYRTSTSVEITRALGGEFGVKGWEDEVVVYASGQFEDGGYVHVAHDWYVRLKSDWKPACKLADMRQCHICIGGGFPIQKFGDDQIMHYRINIKKGNNIGIYFKPLGLEVGIVIHGWPEEEWDLYRESHSGLEYIIDSIAERHPGATVRFEYIAWPMKHIRGPLKRLLPQKRREEIGDELRYDKELQIKTRVFCDYATPIIESSLGDEVDLAVKEDVLDILLEWDVDDIVLNGQADDTRKFAAISIVTCSFQELGKEHLYNNADLYKERVQRILQDDRDEGNDEMPDAKKPKNDK